MSAIVCGPIVGHVTQSRAVVLLEVADDVMITCSLRDRENAENEASVQIQMTARRPYPFVFQELTPNTAFDILVAGQSCALGVVRTLPTDIRALKVAVVSCDYAGIQAGDVMWKRLYQSASDKGVHVVLHIGDNVYIDRKTTSNLSDDVMIGDDDALFDPKNADQTAPYVRARKTLHGLESRDWPAKSEEILELYRAEYRRVWSRPEKAVVLANFSNLMLMDDHEVRDNFGSHEEDSNPDHKEFFLGSLALRVYHEYQRQQWDPDILLDGKRDTLVNEFYSLTLGPVGFLVPEVRMVHSLYKGKRRAGDHTYFGAEQCDSLRSLLTGSETEANGTRMWLFLSGFPLMFMKRKINKLAAKTGIAEDLAAFINTYHSADMEPLLDWIKIWKSGNDRKLRRELLVISGDVHMGGFTDIYQEAPERLLCRQVTTSPISNIPYSLGGFAAVRTLLHFTDKYGPYSYRHYDWINTCNYCLLDMDFTVKDDIRYTVSLVSEEGSATRASTDPNWDKGISSKCCHIV